MFSKSSIVQFAKHPFTFRERCRRQRAKARLEEQRASPLLQFGSVMIVNPVYTGPNPYRGPEVYDPKNVGRPFIPVRPPKPAGPREMPRRLQQLQSPFPGPFRPGPHTTELYTFMRQITFLLDTAVNTAERYRLNSMLDYVGHLHRLFNDENVAELMERHTSN